MYECGSLIVGPSNQTESAIFTRFNLTKANASQENKNDIYHTVGHDTNEEILTNMKTFEQQIGKLNDSLKTNHDTVGCWIKIMLGIFPINTLLLTIIITIICKGHKEILQQKLDVSSQEQLKAELDSRDYIPMNVRRLPKPVRDDHMNLTISPFPGKLRDYPDQDQDRILHSSSYRKVPAPQYPLPPLPSSLPRHLCRNN